jgi:hypothetical protein
VLNPDGEPRFVAGTLPDSPVVNRLAQPGDRIFAKKERRRRFECLDGSYLLREGNHLTRYASDGTPLTTYAAPMVYRPFTFLLPAVLAWPYFFVYVFVKQRREQKTPAEATGVGES